SFFNDSALTAISTLSLHDALPISRFFFPRFRILFAFLITTERSFACSRAKTKTTTNLPLWFCSRFLEMGVRSLFSCSPGATNHRSEEHTSELQSRENLVCRLLLEK